MTVRALPGEPGATPLPAAGEALIGFAAGPVGLVVAAASVGVVTHAGEMDEQAVVASHRAWRAYRKSISARKTAPTRCRWTTCARSRFRPPLTSEDGTAGRAGVE